MVALLLDLVGRRALLLSMKRVIRRLWADEGGNLFGGYHEQVHAALCLFVPAGRPAPAQAGMCLLKQQSALQHELLIMVEPALHLSALAAGCGLSAWHLTGPAGHYGEAAAGFTLMPERSSHSQRSAAMRSGVQRS